ncbi:MAG: DinB family protein [Candidatus Thorarchaeota archaeon]
MNIKDQEMRIGPILSKEFHNSWDMLRQAIENITEEFWITTINNWSFSWNIYHIIETAEFYSRNTPLGMEWGKRVGINEEMDTEEEINRKKSRITKEFLLDYLKEIEDKITNILTNSKDDDFFKTDEFDKGTLYVFEKLIYLLRHNMHHIGELNKVLRDSNNQRISWR